ncbi:MAG: hypothetical protein QNJ45_02035 [Ardenticatenaceae bacterium]|nr:hypothetical protein [Ardenticatenaceae bacterium]
MEGFVVVSLAIVGIGFYFFYFDNIGSKSEKVFIPSKEELLGEKERTLNELVLLEKAFRRGMIGKGLYLTQRMLLKRQAAATARRMSRYVLMSRESLTMMIDTDEGVHQAAG